jgi:hypothetical protein
MSFNFQTLADADKAQADKAAQYALMGWDKIKKPGANPEPKSTIVDSGTVQVKPVRKKK